MMNLVLALTLLLSACAQKHSDPFHAEPPAPAADTTDEAAALSLALSKYRDRPHRVVWWFGHHYAVYLCDDPMTCPERGE